MSTSVTTHPQSQSEMFKYGLLGLLVLGWTLNPFMKRRAIGKLTSMDYFIVNLPPLSGSI